MQWIVQVIGEMREKKGDEKKLRVVREGHVVSDKVVGEAVCKNKDGARKGPARPRDRSRSPPGNPG